MKILNPLGGLGLLLLIFLSSTEAAAAKASAAKNGQSQSLKNWLRSMRPKRDENSLTSDRVWTLADALPGEPERDYPIYATVPDTDFTCKDKHYGYYADTEARCQAFHICANTAGSAKGFGFLCPNGTLFNQRFFVCDWYMNVDCESSSQYYNLNDLIGDSMDGFTHGDIMNTAKEIMGFPQTMKGGFDGGIPKGSTGGGSRITGGNGNRNGATSRPATGISSNNGGGGGSFPTPGGGSSSRTPSRGSADLGQPIGSNNANYPYSPGSSSNGSGNRQSGPSRPNGASLGPNNNNINSPGYATPTRGGGPSRNNNLVPSAPGRDSNGGTVPDKDSTFDQDTRIPSNSFDTLKGIGNSYSFGFPGDNNNNAPLRGSLDLSEPVDPSAYGRTGPPNLNGGRKQMYTYPNDIPIPFGQNGNHQQPSFPPEFTGQINMKLAAQSPKYPTPQVYGPPVTQISSPQRPSSSSSLPQGQTQRVPSSSSYPQSQGQTQRVPSTTSGSGYPQSQSQRVPQTQGQRVPQTQGQRVPQSQGPRIPSSTSGSGYPQSQSQRIPSLTPETSYPQGQVQVQRGPTTGQFPSGQSQRGPSTSSGPSYPQNQLSNGQRAPSATPSSQQTQFPSSQSYPQGQSQRGPSSPSSSQFPSQPQPSHKAIPQAYQPSRPQTLTRTGGGDGGDAPNRLYQSPHQSSSSPSQSNNFRQSSNIPQPFSPSNSQQSQRRQFSTSPNNGNYYQNPSYSSPGGSGSNGGQSNEDYLRVILKDRNYVHDDNQQLVELIQRFFTPQRDQIRVISAEVQPSTEQESYSFTYDGSNGDASNRNNVYSTPNRSGYHQHSNVCGHQGY